MRLWKWLWKAQLLPWNRCRAALEKKGDSAYYGQCDRPRNHPGWHALERGFDIVWFSTRLIDMNNEWSD
jgi:hypothetical protein